MGHTTPYIGAGLKLFECPISYAFHHPLSAGLIDAYHDREAGIVPSWGQGSALYHESMKYIHSCAKEREREAIREMSDNGE